MVNELCFVALVMGWLRAWGIEVEVQWQEDWGPEFGGENPHHLAKLEEKYYRPFRARLCRAPKGRKGYQGRVERSHRIDDEEFYIPCLGEVTTAEEFLALARKWQWNHRGASPFQGGDEGEDPDREAVGVGIGSF